MPNRLWIVAIVLLCTYWAVPDTSPRIPAVGASATPDWTVLLGGFHYVQDIAIDPSGTMWAVGSGVISDEVGSWKVSDSVPGYALTAIALTGNAIGWVAGNPQSGSERYDGFIGQLYAGAVVTREYFPYVYWTDMHALTAGDVWAVGSMPNRGLPVMYYYDGTRWHDYSPKRPGDESDPVTASHPRAVTMLSRDEGYSIDEEGRLWIWNGMIWDVWTELRRSADCTIEGFDVVAGDDIWVAGGGENRQLIARFHDNRWSTYLDREGPHLYSIAMASPLLGWAVGGTGAIYVYDGVEWSFVGASDPYGAGDMAALLTVTVDGLEEHAWAGGMNGHILRLNRGSFSWMHPPGGRFLTAIAADASGDLLIGGGRCACWTEGRVDMPGDVPVLARFRERALIEDRLPALRGPIRGVAIDDAGVAWAVGGAYEDDAVAWPQSAFAVRYVGEEWQPVTVATRLPLHGVEFGEDGSGWAFGYNGVVGTTADSALLRYRGDTWMVEKELPVGAAVYDFSARADADVWMAGRDFSGPRDRQAVVWRWDGSALRAWRLRGTSVMAIDTFGRDIAWVAVVEDSRAKFYRRDGDQWLLAQDSPWAYDLVRSLRLMGREQGYAGGMQGSISRWDGREWKADWGVSDPMTGFLVMRGFAAVKSPAGELTVVALGGTETLLRRSGSGSVRPTPEESPPPPGRTPERPTDRLYFPLGVISTPHS